MKLAPSIETNPAAREVEDLKSSGSIVQALDPSFAWIRPWSDGRVLRRHGSFGRRL